MGGMTAITDIRAVHWQPQLSGDGVLTNLDDLRQAIRIVLSTPKGSDPLRPDFGSGLPLYIDWPLDRARPHIVRETVEAIRRWEPRLEVRRVEVEPSDVAALRIRVAWQVKDGILNTTVVDV
jgi:phage baseplate assembly protein W